MYQAYWGLARTPFAGADGRAALSASPVHAEALARLDFLRESGARFGLLLGPPGSGKSLVLTEFADRAARNGVLVASTSAAIPAQDSLLDCLTAGWQLAPAAAGPLDWQAVADRLDELRLENLAAVLLLDDLDRATPAVLAAVEWLVGLPAMPVTVVATARLATAAKIGRPLLEQAALRIDLTPWNEREIADYLTTSLTNAGRLQPAFNEAATRRLYELSAGVPRKVNRLAQLALVAGAGQNLTQIDAQTVEAVEEELSV